MISETLNFRWRSCGNNTRLPEPPHLYQPAAARLARVLMKAAKRFAGDPPLVRNSRMSGCATAIGGPEGFPEGTHFSHPKPQLRSFFLTGPSCAGKTSLFSAPSFSSLPPTRGPLNHPCSQRDRDAPAAEAEIAWHSRRPIPALCSRNFSVSRSPHHP